jgi:hypothetical protein
MMADLKDFSEQFEAWWLTKFSAEFLDSDNCWSAWTGWQARGELDVVRIKEWQSLSDDEIWDIANFLGKNKEWDYPIMFARLIERALREKNG